MNTLIVDAEGVYDPRLLNGRLLLGLKGTMGEAELGWIRQQAWEGALNKAVRVQYRPPFQSPTVYMTRTRRQAASSAGGQRVGGWPRAAWISRRTVCSQSVHEI
jgi:hypothetical protein